MRQGLGYSKGLTLGPKWESSSAQDLFQRLVRANSDYLTLSRKSASLQTSIRVSIYGRSNAVSNRLWSLSFGPNYHYL